MVPFEIDVAIAPHRDGLLLAENGGKTIVNHEETAFWRGFPLMNGARIGQARPGAVPKHDNGVVRGNHAFEVLFVGGRPIVDVEAFALINVFEHLRALIVWMNDQCVAHECSPFVPIESPIDLALPHRRESYGRGLEGFSLPMGFWTLP